MLIFNKNAPSLRKFFLYELGEYNNNDAASLHYLGKGLLWISYPTQPVRTRWRPRNEKRRGHKRSENTNTSIIGLCAEFSARTNP